MMKYKFAYLLNVVLYVLVCISCSKDENNNSNNFATGIVELPALRNGANDVFVTLHHIQWAESNFFQYGIR